MLNLLERLCSASGVSGFEAQVAELIIDEIKEYADDVFFDKLGSLIAFKKGKKRAEKKVLYAAHMDEVGLVVNFIEENGLLRFDAIGISPLALPAKHVFVGEKRIKGVIASKPVHLLKTEEKNKSLKIEELYIDIGAENKEQAGRSVSLFDYAVFDSSFLLQGDMIKAKALDDRIGCALLCELIKSDLEYDAYFAFTVGEELGARGAGAVTNLIKPDLAVVVECTTAGDIDGVPDAEKVCIVGNGAVVPFMDGGTAYDKELYQFTIDLAQQNNIKCQTKT